MSARETGAMDVDIEIAPLGEDYDPGMGSDA